MRSSILTTTVVALIALVSGPALAQSWSAEFDGTDAFARVEGQTLQGMALGSTLQVNGIAEAATLMLRLTLGGSIEPGTYPPSLVSVSYSDSDQQCVGGSSVSVTIESVDPLRGSFTGPMTCRHSRDGREKGTEVTVQGRFDEGD